MKSYIKNTCRSKKIFPLLLLLLISQFASANDNNSKKILFTDKNGKRWYSENAGKDWIEQSPIIPIEKILENRNGTKFFSANGGKTWQKVYSSKVEKPIFVEWENFYSDTIGSIIKINPSKEGYLFVTDKGATSIIAETDKSGSLVWKKEFGALKNITTMRDVECTENNIRSAGFSDPVSSVGIALWGLRVERLDKSGSPIFSRAEDTILHMELPQVVMLKNGGYAVTHFWGYATASTYVDFHDAEGRRLKRVWHDTIPSAKLVTLSAEETHEGGLLIAGSEQTEGEDITKVYIIKTDAEGKRIWRKTIGDTRSAFNPLVYEQNDGSIIVTYNDFNKRPDSCFVFIRKMDSDGNMVWENNFGFQDYFTQSHALTATEGGDIMIAGRTSPRDSLNDDVIYTSKGNAFFIKTNSNGVIQQKNVWVGDNGSGIYSILPLDNQSAVVSGWHNKQAYVAKIMMMPTSVEEFAPEVDYFSLSPNPSSSATTISYVLKEPGVTIVKVFNQLGQEITVLKNKWEETGLQTAIFESADLPDGIYYIQLYHNGKQRTEKFVKY